MGRLIGIKYFLSQAAYNEEKGWQTLLRRLRRESLDDTPAEDISHGDYDPYKSMQCEIAQLIRKQFGDRLLRRTQRSLTPEGNPLISLPPLEEHTFVIELQPWELLIIDALTAQVAAEYVTIWTGHGIKCIDCILIRLNDVSFSRILSTRFYLEYRMGVGYARQDLKDPIPSFKTMDDWTARKATKIDTCARICQYLTSTDRAGIPYVEDGAVCFPPIPPLGPGKQDKRTNKVLIYQEFPSLGPLLRNVSGCQCLCARLRLIYFLGPETLQC